MKNSQSDWAMGLMLAGDYDGVKKASFRGVVQGFQQREGGA